MAHIFSHFFLSKYTLVRTSTQLQRPSAIFFAVKFLREKAKEHITSPCSITELASVSHWLAEMSVWTGWKLEVWFKCPTSCMKFTEATLPVRQVWLTTCMWLKRWYEDCCWKEISWKLEVTDIAPTLHKNMSDFRLMITVKELQSHEFFLKALIS